MSNPLPKHDLTPAARMSPNRKSDRVRTREVKPSAAENLATPRAAVAWNRASYSSVDAERVMRSMACIAEWADAAMELRRPFYNYPFSALRAIRDEARACILANTKAKEA